MNLHDFTLTSISKIRHAMNKNKLIVFVGAGVSANSGLPSWNHLVQELASEIGFSDNKKYEELCSLLNDEQKNRFRSFFEKLKKFSTDDYLKIPQYYFVEYGEHLYQEKIKRIFQNTNEPNPINYLIFDLNPVHIITTNYDSLLETTATLKNLNYSPVSNDKALAQAENTKLIVKMHGDFDKLVLKESDYDTYSNDFKLIETYVKGLIATNTILFVGFSAEDANVRKIFQWVKDILGDSHKPAYLLNIDNIKNTAEKEKQRIKSEYLKRININTIFYDEIASEISAFATNEALKLYSSNIPTKIGDGNYYGMRLFKLLYYIIYQQDTTNESATVSKYYDLLKGLGA